LKRFQFDGLQIDDGSRLQLVDAIERAPWWQGKRTIDLPSAGLEHHPVTEDDRDARRMDGWIRQNPQAYFRPDPGGVSHGEGKART
jgi:hypothetical protein